MLKGGVDILYVTIPGAINQQFHQLLRVWHIDLHCQVILKLCTFC